MSILVCGLKKKKKKRNQRMKNMTSHETNMKGWLKADKKVEFHITYKC